MGKREAEMNYWSTETIMQLAGTAVLWLLFFLCTAVLPFRHCRNFCLVSGTNGTERKRVFPKTALCLDADDGTKIDGRASEKTGGRKLSTLRDRFRKDDFSSWSILTGQGERLPSMRTIAAFFPYQILVYELTSRVTLAATRFPIWCELDKMIPVCDFFVLPYLSWHALLPVVGLYLLKTDLTGLRRFIKYLLFTSITTLVVFIVWPTVMPLRPESVEIKGVLSWVLSVVYTVDENTNVMPSMHVIWAFGMLFALWKDKLFSKPVLRVVCFVQTILICISTFMIKQHSVLDVLGAIPFTLAGWFLCYRTRHNIRDRKPGE